MQCHYLVLSDSWLVLRQLSTVLARGVRVLGKGAKRNGRGPASHRRIRSYRSIDKSTGSWKTGAVSAITEYIGQCIWTVALSAECLAIAACECSKRLRRSGSAG